MKRTLLIGPRDSGKTFAANLMLNGRKTFVINAWSLRDIQESDVHDSLFKKFWHATGDYDTIFVDDIPVRLLEKVSEYFFNEEYQIVAQMKKPYTLQPQEVVLACTCKLFEVPGSASFVKRFNVYECRRANAAGVYLLLINTQLNQPISNPY